MDQAVGRPRIYTEQDDPLKIVSMRLPNWHVRVARKLGKGNLSEGVRIALEHQHQNQEGK